MPAQWHPICAAQRVVPFTRWVSWRGPDWQCQPPNDGTKRHVGQQSVHSPKALCFQGKGSKQAEGLQTQSVSLSLCLCGTVNVSGGIHSCEGGLAAMPSGCVPALNTRLSLLSPLSFHVLAAVSLSFNWFGHSPLEWWILSLTNYIH